jgi:hypothetical protein
MLDNRAQSTHVHAWMDIRSCVSISFATFQINHPTQDSTFAAAGEYHIASCSFLLQAPFLIQKVAEKQLLCIY